MIRLKTAKEVTGVDVWNSGLGTFSNGPACLAPVHGLLTDYVKIGWRNIYFQNGGSSYPVNNVLDDSTDEPLTASEVSYCDNDTLDGYVETL